MVLDYTKSKLKKLCNKKDIDWITKNLAIACNGKYTVLDADYVVDVSKLSKNSIIPQKIDDIINFMLGRLADGERIIVSCEDGKSKSAMIIIAFLIKYGGLTISGATNKVISKRPYVKLSKAQITNLVEYNNYLASLVKDMSEYAVRMYCM